jgi:serine phosphatase RsbU (regulator of sigma subunit)
MAWLVALDEAAQGRRFPLDAPCLIGRGPLNHIVIDDTRISRQHAKISPEEDGWVLYDLNSANGTFVNDVKVSRTRLAHGDVVIVGPFKFVFELKRTRAATPAPVLFGGELEVQTITGAVPPVSRILESVDAIAVGAPMSIAGISELEDADRKLRTLYSFMQSISSTLELAELVQLVVDELLGVFPAAELVTIHLRDERTGELEPRRSIRRRPAESGLLTTRDIASVPAMPLAVQVISEVVQKGRAILSAPITAGAVQPRRRLTMHAPLVYRGVVEGVLEVHGSSTTDTPFGQRDLDLLNGLAALAAMALHSTRMHLASLRQVRLEQDLLFAREIQHSFLPHELPDAPGLELAAEYAPAYSVGGDFYDLFWMSDTELGLFIGDVAGKGVSAALLMARMSSDLRMAALAEREPGRALERLNRTLLSHHQLDLFITAVCLTIDVSTGLVTLANAGHLPPLVRRHGGELEPILGGAGTAVGFFEDTEFPQVRFELEPGDAIVLCTDGVLEATSADGEHFGYHRIQASLAGAGPSAVEIAQRLLVDVRAHGQGVAPYDDLTLLVARRR